MSAAVWVGLGGEDGPYREFGRQQVMMAPDGGYCASVAGFKFDEATRERVVTRLVLYASEQAHLPLLIWPADLYCGRVYPGCVLSFDTGALRISQRIWDRMVAYWPMFGEPRDLYVAGLIELDEFERRLDEIGVAS